MPTSITRLSWILSRLGLVGVLLLGLTLVPASLAQEGPVVHVVQPGENLYFIANRYGVTGMTRRWPTKITLGLRSRLACMMAWMVTP